MAGKVDPSTGAIIELAEKMGELKGLVTSLITQQGSTNQAIVELNKDLDTKHKENLELIGRRHDENRDFTTEMHDENRKLLESHKDDDRVNFARVIGWQENATRWIKIVCYIWGAMSGGGLLVLAFVKWVIPLMQQSKGLGE